MSAREWYTAGFVLTLLAALTFWSLAVIIYRKDRRNPLNRSLALTFLLGGLWLPFGFVEKITSQPNDALALWSYRLAHAFGNPALLCLFLFTLTLYLGRSPSRKILYGLYGLGIIMVAISLSPWGIGRVTYSGGTLEVFAGPLYPVINVFQVVCTIGVLFCLIRKWRTSTGIDHARTSTMLLGISVLLPVGILCNIIIPSITGNAISSNITFLVGATIPPAAFYYSIYKLRLLDIRLILRKSGVAVIVAILVSLPIIGILVLSEALNFNLAFEICLSVFVLLLLVAFYPNIWNRVERLSARAFFSSLYDSVQMQEELTSLLAKTANPTENIHLVLGTLLITLGLDKAEFWFTPQEQSTTGGYYRCSRDEEDKIEHDSLLDAAVPKWLNRIQQTMITEELERWPKSQDEKELGEALSRQGISACAPAQTGRKILGYILVGEKYNRQALSATDIDLMEKVGSRLALYLDNYALSTELSLRLEELSKADEFKREVIVLTAHEFKTPITVVSGLSEILKDNWETLDEDKKEMCLTNMRKASLRLVELSDEVFLLANYYAGTLTSRISLINIDVLLEKLIVSYPENYKSRIVVDKTTDHNIIPSDLDQLFVVLKQVVNNALSFSDDHQPVVISVVDDPHNEKLLNIAIQDFGKGLSREDISRVFEPFFQVEDLRYHAKGIGLGLQLVKILSAILGVKIGIESELGKGTKIILDVPIRSSPV
jgi:signal transduction histidine kinase